MASHSLLLFGLSLLLYSLVCSVNPLSNGPDFTSTTRTFTGFKTEPTLITEDFEIQRIPIDRNVLSPGYIFMNSMMKSPKYGHGLSIYTEEGELVWRGSQKRLAQNLHVCDYLGSRADHLCYFTRWTKHRIPNLPEGERLGSPITTYGRLVILDSSYKEVSMFKSGFDELAFNGHAFETHDNGFTATTIVARPRAVDLSERGGPKEGWILNQCLQELDLPSGNDTFHWCYYDSGMSLWASKYIPFIGPATKINSWDFLHTNAVAKNAEGNYIASFRHADMLVKIAGNNNTKGVTPGEVIWKLGGKFNDFTMIGFNTKQGFTRQHDVQVISTNDTVEVISIFNNAWDEFFGPSQQWSDGQIIAVNTQTMEATLVHDYPHPRWSQGRGRSLSGGRGSVQRLPNANLFVGWGRLPDLTEFSENGTVLYHTRYRASVHTTGQQFSYRSYKAPWVGKPHWPPKLVAYSQDCEATKSPLWAFVSHNGATEITNWRFSASETPEGPWMPLGTYPKTGFETKTRLPRNSTFDPYIRAEALDANGTILSAKVSPVFVPNEEVTEQCHQRSCKRNFEYRRSQSRATDCYTPVWHPKTHRKGKHHFLRLSTFSYSSLGALAVFIEAIVWAFHTVFPYRTSWIPRYSRD